MTEPTDTQSRRPTLKDLHAPGARGTTLPALDVPPAPLPEEDLLRTELDIPELSELDLVRYFTGLSKLNFGIDSGFYPLGSCTMKYNPKWHEEVARLPGFAQIHPLQPAESVQGALAIMYGLQNLLAEITGAKAVSLAPLAGAHGEMAGLLMIRAYHESRGEGDTRKQILIPDTAHGTNAASSKMCGYDLVTAPSDAQGNLDVEALKELATSETAALMLTLPSTLGLFNPRILEICDAIHSVGAMVYGDGANLNAILGRVRFGDLGFDVVHSNLHKTFSTPHGGGGPGAGPVCAAESLDVDALKELATSETAALMLTLPSTLGLFNPRILEICAAIHSVGAMVYGDGANLNAILGRVRFGDLGFDVVHSNLHKTFSTPHGGGGPGAGPVCAAESLADFLPAPVVYKSPPGSPGPEYQLGRPSKSIGKISAFHCNFGVVLRAYAYIRLLGAPGMREISENAVLNANYLLARLEEDYLLPNKRICMHEVVFSASKQKAHGVRALDISKRLMDYGFHPPTMYFPQVVPEALMIEPTECESKRTLDTFVDAMKSIAREAETNPDIVTSAPHTTPSSRLDEAQAARHPDLHW